MRKLSPLAAALALAATALIQSPVRADDKTPLIVVGTSDVYDSNLVQSVIEPGFEKANPQYDLQYVSKGTGDAIAYAKAGSAAALIVHAASLENQFVADGYSYEPYGRATFWGDYVILGPKSDPVGVKASDEHDVVGAFNKIAAAGAAGKATFVSRGGTPGTTVQEHAIWSLATGTTLCKVSAAKGGGSSPSTTGGDCPATIGYPDWYKATGLTQGPNILAADTCNFDYKNCYVMTDRGTYAYLKSTGKISNLDIVARDNSATATGGPDLLVNSFHAYAVNPAKFAGVAGAKVDSVGAVKLLDWITSVDGQKAIGSFLNADNDPPFVPDASPTLTPVSVPNKPLPVGKSTTLKVKVANVVPGTPALSGIPVKLNVASTASSTVWKSIRTATTDATGTATFTVKPSRSYVYQASTDQLKVIENSALSPQFGDLLSPSAAVIGTVAVTSRITITKVTTSTGRIIITGKVSPKALGNKARIAFYSGKKSGKLTWRTTRVLKKGKSTFTYSFKARPGTWYVRLGYGHKGVLVQGKSAVKKVTVR